MGEYANSRSPVSPMSSFVPTDDEKTLRKDDIELR
jgi:hypothetical protein